MFYIYGHTMTVACWFFTLTHATNFGQITNLVFNLVGEC